MRAPLGKMIYVDPNQFQKSVETKELRPFLTRNGIQDISGFQSHLETIFQTGSNRRSFIFMNVPIREYAPRRQGENACIPVFGVKGAVAGITRASNYSEIFTAGPDEMRAGEFIRKVFGTSYMTPAEGVEESDRKAFSVLTRQMEPVSVTIPDDTKDVASIIMTRIWSALERDPRTRIILRIPGAEIHSMELLRALYLLMPTSLKLQTGFETNIATEDLRQISQGLPISVLTVDEDVHLNTAGLSFPICEIAVAELSGMRPDPEKFRLVRTCAENMNDISALLLDYADETVRGQQNNAFPSFRYYGDVLRANPDIKTLLAVNDDLSAARRALGQAQEQVRREQEARAKISNDCRRLQDNNRQANAYIGELKAQIGQQEQRLRKIGNPKEINRQLNNYKKKAASLKRTMMIETILLIIAIAAVVFLFISGKPSGGKSSSDSAGTVKTETTQTKGEKKSSTSSTAQTTLERAVPEASESVTEQEVPGQSMTGNRIPGSQGNGSDTGSAHSDTFNNQNSGTSGGTSSGSGTSTGIGTGNGIDQSGNGYPNGYNY